MANYRTERTADERLAEQIVGIESDAVTMNMGSDYDIDAAIHNEKVEKFNQAVNDLQERFEKHINDIQETGRQMAADMNNIEIMPLTSYALITPYKTNPFQQIETKSGLIVGGFAPEYLSQETGETNEETQYVKVGMVTEVGPECKFLLPGDVVFYNVASEVQVPFFRFGFVIVAEQRILAVVNEHLTERKEEVMKMNKK